MGQIYASWQSILSSLPSGGLGWVCFLIKNEKLKMNNYDYLLGCLLAKVIIISLTLTFSSPFPILNSQFKTRQIAVQYAIFCTLKGRISQREMRPFVKLLIFS